MTMMKTKKITLRALLLVIIVAFILPVCCKCYAFLSSGHPSSGSGIRFVDSRRNNIEVVKRRKCSDSFTTTASTSSSYLYSTTKLHNVVVEEESSNVLSTTTTTTTTTTEEPNEKEELLLIDKLRDYVKRNDTTPITISNAYVLSKRSLGKNLINFDIATDKHTSTQQTTPSDYCCQVMFRREFFFSSSSSEDDESHQNNNNNNYDAYKRCLLKGTKYNITGIASSTRIPGNVVLLAQSITLVSVPRQSQHIQIILQQAFIEKKSISQSEVCNACNDPTLRDKIHNNLLLKQKSDREMKKYWKQLSKDILTNLPDDPNYPKDVILSNLGKFVRPIAPTEWQHIPKQIIDDDGHDDVNEKVDAVAAATTTLTYDEIPSINEAVQYLQTEATTSRISVQGWVQNRRRFDNNITMISLIDELNFGGSSNNNESENDDIASSIQNNTSNDDDRLVAIIHPDLLEQCSGLYSNIVAVETKIWVSGILIDSGGGGSNSNRKQTLWVQQIRLVQSSSRPATIRYILDLLHSKQLDLEEVADALKLPYADAMKIQQDTSIDAATQRQWTANELARKLQQSKRNVINPELLQIIEKYNYLSDEFQVIMDDNEKSKEEEKSKFSEVAMTSSSRIMQKPAIGMPGTRWQSKKRPQLEWMGRQIRSVLQSHPEYGKRTLSILDIGGGKGSLATYLGSHIDNVQIHVVDIAEGAIMNGAKKAKRLQLENIVQFQTADASNPQFTLLSSEDDDGDDKNKQKDDDGSKGANSMNADIVVALHACGHLSDVALGHAVHHRAGFVIVPCCFNSNPSLTMPYFGNNNDDNKFDGLAADNRDDEKVNDSVPHWLGIPPEDWSRLKLLAEVQGDIDLASKGMSLVCGLRAKAVTRHRRSYTNDHDFDDTNFDIKIRQFPLQYSTRNTVLIGKWSS